MATDSPGGMTGARRLLLIAAVALAYLAAARFGLSLAFGTKQVTAVWPPTGLALAALLLLGRGLWPGIALGAFAANAMADEPLSAAAGIAAGNTLEALAGATLLWAVAGFRPSLDRVKDVLALLLVAAASSAISASIGVATLVLHGLVPADAAAQVWRLWWVGDAMGDLLVAPFLLAWLSDPRMAWRGRRLLELVVLLAALTAACVAVFTSRRAESAASFQIEYAAFPFLIWAALRFGQREAATASLLVSSIAIWGAVQQSGPFSTGTQDRRLILLDVFMAVSALTALLLGAATAEQGRSEEALREAHHQLERRVEERTAQLAAANGDLSRLNQDLEKRTRELAEKNEEVEAFVYIVSHDLRAPLVNLMGFSKELELSCAQLGPTLAEGLSAGAAARVKPILDEEIPASLRFIRASAGRFQKLIEALLALSRTGRESYRRDPIDVQALVGSVVDSLQSSIQASGAKVTLGVLPPALGDATAVSQVFANLISNAVKYLAKERPGAIEVGGESDGALSRYWVRDNGAGIPESARPRLFQVFQRFHPALAPGEGMGLAIVKRVVERHGGQVRAESAEGGGTIFHLSLPAAPAVAIADVRAGA